MALKAWFLGVKYYTSKIFPSAIKRLKQVIVVPPKMNKGLPNSGTAERNICESERNVNLVARSSPASLLTATPRGRGHQAG